MLSLIKPNPIKCIFQMQTSLVKLHCATDEINELIDPSNSMRNFFTRIHQVNLFFDLL